MREEFCESSISAQDQWHDADSPADLPPLRGHLRPDPDDLRRQAHRRPRRPRRRVQQGFHLPEGRELRRTRQRPRPIGAAIGPARRRADRGHLGRGVRRGRRGSGRGRRRARRNLGRGVSRQPERAHGGRRAVPTGAHPRTRHPPGVQREHARPDAQARRARPDVRQPGRLHRARPRPHRLPRRHRRESPCVQRKCDHRRRLSEASCGRCASAAAGSS